MVDHQKALVELLNSLPIETMFWLSIKIAIVFMFVLAAKNLLESTVDYFQLRGNKFVSIGTQVCIDHFTGKIKSISLKTIVIENDRGYYVIQTRGWDKHQWQFIKTYCTTCEKNPEASKD